MAISYKQVQNNTTGAAAFDIYVDGVGRGRIGGTRGPHGYVAYKFIVDNTMSVRTYNRLRDAKADAVATIIANDVRRAERRSKLQAEAEVQAQREIAAWFDL